MQAWWRVLRGIWPYRIAVTISILCAFGVGLSYAGSVAAMLPVMKIFISTEGIHGWANRIAAEQRLKVDLLEQDNASHKRDDPSALALVVFKTHGEPGWPLNNLAVGDHISQVAFGDNTSLLTRNNHLLHDSTDWQDMVRMLAAAPPGTPVRLTILHDKQPPQFITVALPALPRYTAGFVKAIDHLPDNPTQSLVYVVGGFVLMTLVGNIFRYFQQRAGMTVAARVIMDLRRRAYVKILQFPISYTAQKGTSDLTSRLTQDTGTLTDGVSMILGKSVQEPIKAIGAAVVALWFNWWLSLIVLLIVPLLGIVIRKLSKKMRRASQRTLEGWSSMLAIIEETLRSLRVVKAYSAENYERRRFARVNKDLLHQQRRMIHYAALSRPLIEVIEIILVSVPVLLAAWLVLSQKIDREIFFTLLALYLAILEPLRKLSDVNSKIQQANAAAVRVFEMIDQPVEDNYRHDLPHLPAHQRTIEFHDVTFAYPGHEEKVLFNVSLKVKHGQTVAVVGANGSGKTTLMALLPRLYAPSSGAVFVDGVDIATVSIRSLRKQIGLVTQDPVLFADSIYNNIAYGTRHSTVQQVMEASRRAYADEFIRTFPDGYETKIGEHGVRLSGGQKQRIAIARAILHQPAILILDEAMSQIDSDSEMKISLVLREFMRNRTTFIIAHRFATVVSADLICCLDAGRVVGLGTHQELVEECPSYRRLYENQFRDAG